MNLEFPRENGRDWLKSRNITVRRLFTRGIPPRLVGEATLYAQHQPAVVYKRAFVQ